MGTLDATVQTDEAKLSSFTPSKHSRRNLKHPNTQLRFYNLDNLYIVCIFASYEDYYERTSAVICG